MTVLFAVMLLAATNCAIGFRQHVIGFRQLPFRTQEISPKLKTCGNSRIIQSKNIGLSMSDDVDDIIDVNSVGDDEFDNDDDDEIIATGDFDQEEVVVSNTNWKERMKTSSKKQKKGWEDKFEDDPLRATSGNAKEYEAPKIPFSSWFLVIGFVEGEQMLEKREDSWIRHMQWLRRSALAHGHYEQIGMDVEEGLFDEDYPLKVEWEYTLLSDDCMSPVGQIIAVRANSSEDVKGYLQNEPLSMSGGIGPWSVLDMSICDDEHESLSHDVRPSPYIFFGQYAGADTGKAAKVPKAKPPTPTEIAKVGHSGKFEMSLNHQLDCNNAAELDVEKETRVSFMAKLANAEEELKTNGIVMVFSARSNKDAVEYIANDPVIGATTRANSKESVMKQSSSEVFEKMVLAPVNLQDVSGLHHLIPRTYGEKTQLDLIHYMDPEDLLLEDNGEDVEDNRALLEKLQDNSISYRYDRLEITDADIDEDGDENEDEEDHDYDSKEGMADRWNKVMAHYQRVLRKNAGVDAMASSKNKSNY